MATWTITIPIGLILRLAAVYLAFGVLITLPADRVVWALYRRRGFPGSYLSWVSSKRSAYYRRGFTQWPRLILSTTAASYRMKDYRAR